MESCNNDDDGAAVEVEVENYICMLDVATEAVICVHMVLWDEVVVEETCVCVLGTMEEEICIYVVALWAVAEEVICVHMD